VLLFITLKLADAVRNFINNKPLGISDVLMGILVGGVVAWTKIYNDRNKKPEQAVIIEEKYTEE
jgi:hypothetical protein